MRPDTFARKLEIALRRAGSSQARLAREAEIDQSSISRYLRGQCEPNLRQFRAIAHALRVEPSFLLSDEDERVVLVPSGEAQHFYVFRGTQFVGEWVGERHDVFSAAVIADDAQSRELLATVPRLRLGARTRPGGARSTLRGGQARARGNNGSKNNGSNGRKRR